MHTSLRLIRVECYRQGHYIRSYTFNCVTEAIEFTKEANLIAVLGNRYMLVVLS
jgi:hypothetical protein